jgi:predicted permease
MMPHGLATDVRTASRRLRAAPGFSLLAVLTLATGIGAVSTVFSLAHALWLKPLPWLEPDRVVTIYSRHEPSGSTASLTPADLREHSRADPVFSGVAGFMYGSGIARVNDERVRIWSFHVTPNLFRVLGVLPAMGRDFDQVGAAARTPVVMLSHGSWLRRFGADPAVVGKSLSMNGTSYEVIGVMPRGFSFPRGMEAEVWLPADLDASSYEGAGRVMQTVARLAPGRSIQEAAVVVQGRARQAAAGVTASRTSRLTLQALLGLVLLFLAIACTNLAGLVMARNAGRRAELAVCLSLGATPWRLARSLLVESAVLSAAGCVAGVLLATHGARLLASFLPRNTPGLDDVEISIPVLLVAAAVSMVSAMGVSLLPAVSLRSIRAADALGVRGEVRRVSRGQRAVVVAEIAMAVVLLVGAAAMVQSFIGVLERDRGYDPRGLQALNVSLPFGDESYRPTGRRAHAFAELVDRVAALPGVTGAAATTGFPGSRLGLGPAGFSGPPSGPRGGRPWAPPGGAGAGLGGYPPPQRRLLRDDGGADKGGSRLLGHRHHALGRCRHRQRRTRGTLPGWEPDWASFLHVDPRRHGDGVRDRGRRGQHPADRSGRAARVRAPVASVSVLD